MADLEALKREVNNPDVEKIKSIGDILYYRGYREHYRDSAVISRAYALANVFTEHKKHIYENDLILGSVVGRHLPEGAFSQAEADYAKKIVQSYGRVSFQGGVDHYTPDFETFLELGVGGVLEKIERSLERYQGEKEKTEFLTAAKISMSAFSDMILSYAEAAEKKAEASENREQLQKAAAVCRKVATQKPETFYEALQLVWMIHLSFLYEQRYAMALGRMDQYLYPFYEQDIRTGILDDEKAVELLSFMLYKIDERRLIPEEPGYVGGSDVVNICIGGLKRDGSDATNQLSGLLIEAVRRCNISGPNLTARMHQNTPDWFWDACLSLIATGLGYPALTNDEATVPALAECGYPIADCRDYSMVGCLEAFMSGKQPPWSDGRYNTPKYVELAINNGICMQTGVAIGPATGRAEEMHSMQDFMDALVKQMEFGVYEQFRIYENENRRYHPMQYAQPYLSCYCRDCIERGRDINDGGAVYPTVYGLGCMGIATVADSLAAIEKLVFCDGTLTLSQLRDILICNFEGYEDIRRKLLEAPKYGNDDDFVDKYAVWYLDIHAELFRPLRTKDGGRVYIAIASNTNNIPAGLEVAATPDGRKNREPLSDAASPMRNMDRSGLTSTILSTSKPDFKKVACGSVMNQKFTSELLMNPEKREKVKALLKVYFQRGGQEIQINTVSKKTLLDAKKHPEKYQNLVVRVSGFSAFYHKLSEEVKEDILQRTEKNE